MTKICKYFKNSAAAASSPDVSKFIVYKQLGAEGPPKKGCLTSRTRSKRMIYQGAFSSTSSSSSKGWKISSWHGWHIPLTEYSLADSSSRNSVRALAQKVHWPFITRSARSGIIAKIGLLKSGGKGIRRVPPSNETRYQRVHHLCLS